MAEKGIYSTWRRKWILLVTLLAVLTTGLVTVIISPSHSAQAHGALQSPASRTYACYQQGPENPTTPACQAAVAAGGTQPLYDWFGVLNSNAAGGMAGTIPDGKLCSGNNPKYAAYDVPRDDWPATNLLAGSQFTFTYGAWVPHPGYFRFFVTNSTYDPTKPLTWANLQSQPFLTVNPEPAVTNGVYSMAGTLPAGVTGRQIIFSIWTRTDSKETFYGCSDVVFSTTGVFPTPTPLPEPTCTATAAVTTSWPGGYQASVSVKNTGALALTPWVVTWHVPTGVTLVSGWNATVIQDATAIVASSPSWQMTLPAGGTATIGYVATGPSSPGPAGMLLDGITCT